MTLSDVALSALNPTQVLPDRAVREDYLGLDHEPAQGHGRSVADGERVLDAAHVATLHAALGTIHERFAALYEVGAEDEFAMEIEFKVTAADALAVKQARPWVY